jgi:hypothetical protein
MKDIASSFSLLMRRGDSRLVIIVSAGILFSLLLLIQNFSLVRDALGFTILPFGKRLVLAWKTLFDISGTFTSGTLILAVLGSLIGGINISLAYTYMRLRGEVLLDSGMYNGLGLIVAFLGIGCAACGSAFLSVVLSLLGFSSMLSYLPYGGEEIGYIGLLFLFMATYHLSKKVNSPLTC